MNNQELIAADLTKKEKSVIAQRKYRERLKLGTSEKSKVTYDNYKKGNADYMRKYRVDRKIKTTQAYALQINEAPAITTKKIAKVNKEFSSTEVRRSGREKKQVDLTMNL